VQTAKLQELYDLLHEYVHHFTYVLFPTEPLVLRGYHVVKIPSIYHKSI